MIIVRMTGGLGNQLFQYATGRALAIRHKTRLKLDLSWFDLTFPEEDGIRYTPPGGYTLDHFCIEADVIGKKELDKHLNRRWPFAKLQHIERYGLDEQQFDPAILSLPKNTYLAGYWKSWKYFETIKEPLHSELTVKTPLEGKNLEISKQIASTNSVCVHVRRGDYVKNPKFAARYGVLPLDYYYECVEELAAEVGAPHLYIFSDDPEWTRANFQTPYPTTFVTHNPIDKNYEDLRLMSSCHHHITAHSTFSWWGAWLGSHPDKIVFTPKKWVIVDTNVDLSDVLPESWRRRREVIPG